MPELVPSKPLEVSLRMLYETFGKRDWWLGFGGLWGLIANRGVIPDGDLDVCFLYPQPWEQIVRKFESRGWMCSKVILNDCDKSKALYAGFNRNNFPHICVSIWYPHNGIRYFCHDQDHELHGPGVPTAGYHFKGVPAWAVENQDAFRMVDWPGIDGRTQVRVPVWPGVLLDHCYPSWAYRSQRYIPKDYNDIRPDKTISYHSGGAISPYRVHLKSMSQWVDARYVQEQLDTNRVDYWHRLKNVRPRLK